jgi:hypothetical protein
MEGDYHMYAKGLVAASMLAAIVGSAYAQTVTLDAGSKMGRTLLCRAEFKAIQAKKEKTADDAQILEYGSQYFQKTCKRGLEAAWEKAHTTAATAPTPQRPAR